MKKIIKDMIEFAIIHHDGEMANAVYNLLTQFSDTYNCPSDWQDLGEEMATKYKGNNWVVENCKLWDFE